MAEITIRISDKALKITSAILGAILVISILSVLWSSGLLQPKYELSIFVPEADGIRAGSDVLLDGMRVGRVSKLRLADNSADSSRRIELTLRIEKRFQSMIRDNSSAYLATNGLFGNRYVSIGRGFAGAPINPGGEIRVREVKEASLTDFITILDKLTKCMEDRKNPAADKPPPSTE
ncbi:MAG TPA: MCE family protein [Candidatus Sulfotelmatobacter sp.]|nr:MCE family protein [Candidatus Sulfotelmatobacter sp.]